MTPPFHLVGEESPCLQPRLRSLSLPKGRVFRTPPLRGLRRRPRNAPLISQ
jgi:hypothetical protein